MNIFNEVLIYHWSKLNYNKKKEEEGRIPCEKD